MRLWVWTGLLSACGNVSSSPDAPPPKTVANLTVTAAGTGTVVSSPPGITCPGTCAADFPIGSAVTLTASSTAPISFAGWSGACAAGRRDCELSLDADATVTATFAMAGEKRWLLTAGAASTTTASNAHAIAARGGDLVLVGRVNGVTSVGGMPTTAAGLLIARLDSDGKAKWVKSIPGPAALEGALDAAGNVYVAGFFDAPTDFGAGEVAPNASSTDAFVAKYDGETGAYLWAKPLGGTFFDFATALAVEPETGDVLVGGSFSRTVNFGGGDITSAGGDTDDIFVARYAAANGAYVWAKTFGNASNEQLYGLAADGSGGVGLAGTYTGTMMMDSMLLPGNAQSNGVFAKLTTATGAVQLAKPLGGANTDSAHNVTVDRAGNWLVVGRYTVPADVGGAPLPAGQTFVAKYTPAGAHLWSRGLTGQALRVAVDSFDDAVVAGNFTGTFDLSGATLSSAGMSDAFVVKLAGSGGATVWAQRFGGASNDQGNGLGVDSLDRPYVAGTFTGFAEFADETPTSKGVNDLYVISLVP
jgi:hypothetical protein